mmetsp:Transcript_48718/g.86714  ORF Transcript_48718/g.86714 Transcript_48718/m.86714 type:complete len:80 (-) Transcript_48718:298-537(-)
MTPKRSPTGFFPNEGLMIQDLWDNGFRPTHHTGLLEVCSTQAEDPFNPPTSRTFSSLVDNSDVFILVSANHSPIHNMHF